MSTRANQMIGFAAYLSSVGQGHRIVELEADHSFFAQGDFADSVFCLQTGRARLSVVSETGKQATIMLLSPGDIFGEGSLATARGKRTGTVTAVNTCTALKISRDEMSRILHLDRDFSDEFVAYLVARNLRTQGDLVDQILNCSEKRLARTLLLLADRREPDESHPVIPPITHEMLAEMIGTTRARVSFFMNRFRSLGLIEYKDRIRVHKPQLKAILVDGFAENITHNAEARVWIG
jgi:CRP/FNR family transcriptional regulator, cyclic AMP receptor protein